MIFSLLICFNLFAWGPTGHRIVGSLAEKHLSPQAKIKLKELLQEETLSTISVWADFIRSDPAWSQASPWHYVSINDGKNYSQTPKNKEGDVIWAIDHFKSVLKDKTTPNSKRVEAIKFLTHFIGDIHQPLHVGRAEDRGGNDIVMDWFGKKTNLHEVVDSLLINHQELSFTEYTEMIDHPTKEQIHLWQNSSTVDWANESQRLRVAFYTEGKDQTKNKEYRFNFKLIGTINDRLLMAGIRLAGVLNKCLE